MLLIRQTLLSLSCLFLKLIQDCNCSGTSESKRTETLSLIERPLSKTKKESIDAIPKRFTLGNPVSKIKERFERDPHRFKTTSLVLNSVCGKSPNANGLNFTIPEKIIEFIGRFEHEKPTMELYNKVMDKLDVASKEREIVDFYKSDFALRIKEMLLMLESKFTETDPFWFDLTRLMFKWLIHIRQRFADNDRKYEKSIEPVEIISFRIPQKQKVNLFLPYKLNFIGVNLVSLPSFRTLIQCEFMENFGLFPIARTIIRNFYNGILNCGLMASEYFNGNVDRNVILKFMLFVYDPIGDVRKCFGDIGGSIEMFFKIQEDESDSMLSKNFDIIGSNELPTLPSPPAQLVTEGIIKFFLKNKKDLLIRNGNDFVIILKKLKEANLLNYSIAKRLIRVGGEAEVVYRRKWCPEDMERLLCNCIAEDPANKKEYFDYLALIQNGNALDELYAKVMGKLFYLSGKGSKCKLNFYDGNFAFNLGQILNMEKSKIPKNDLFWYDALRFVFKLTIHKRQITDDQDRFNEMIADHIVPIVREIQENTDLEFPVNFDLDSLNLSNPTMRNLIECELLENSHVFYKFALVVDDYYNNHGLIESCDDLRTKHFEGSFTKNILLMSMIFMYDPFGGLRECFLDSHYHKDSFLIIESGNNSTSHITELDSTFLSNLSYMGPKDLEIRDLKYTSDCIIHFYMRTNKKIRILDRGSLVTILRKLSEIDLSRMDVIEKLIEFEFKNLETNVITHKWDSDEFKRLFDEAIEHGITTYIEFSF